MDTSLYIADHVGVFFFAISGILAATERNLDILGGIIIAFITALGGGTLRDLLLNVEIAWFSSLSHIIVVLSASLIGILMSKTLRKLRRTFFVFDTLGIGLFTIFGLQKGLSHDQLAITAVFLGLISATFGGVIRDVLCNEIPLIFRKEIYAIPCIVGASIYIVSLKLGVNESTFLLLFSSGVIVLIRTLAVYYSWRVPLLKELENR